MICAKTKLQEIMQPFKYFYKNIKILTLKIKNKNIKNKIHTNTNRIKDYSKQGAFATAGFIGLYSFILKPTKNLLFKATKMTAGVSAQTTTNAITSVVGKNRKGKKNNNNNNNNISQLRMQDEYINNDPVSLSDKDHSYLNDYSQQQTEQSQLQLQQPTNITHTQDISSSQQVMVAGRNTKSHGV